ncbi:nucleotidyl transferase AbiEii/AbiGii toxin family protein [Acididesulfobacillus acetoxydans]|uniref:nucleotidyl transferase AbiEii/AbiGii toxin family protein n=1 Tax=Acididesulfobacillus acetoxydans TaxID=1561005 RepID=UPI001F0FF794|nr:nucleotidyl transferase AbiEii/AbiGii toxin family protein [Acididesulfobacillus acetoxydans]
MWNGVRVASIDAIVAMKLKAIAGRGERKDFIDLYTICQEGMDFDEMLRELIENTNKRAEVVKKRLLELKQKKASKSPGNVNYFV